VDIDGGANVDGGGDPFIVPITEGPSAEYRFDELSGGDLNRERVEEELIIAFCV